MTGGHDPGVGPTRRETILGAAAAGLVPAAVAGQTPASARRVLWAANVRTKGFEDRLRAAEIGGFSHMSVFPVDWRGWTGSGLTAAAMRAACKAAGVRVLAVDPFVQWVPGFALPQGYPSDYLGFIDFTEDDILRIADDLEAEAVNCVEGLGQPHDANALTDALGAFADRAAAAGLRITLEFMPISSIPDLAEGWNILSGVGRDNAGMCFDTWHYFRSTPDPALLATLPGDRIFEVQLADALAALQAPTLTEDLLRFRRLPGDGELPIAEVVGQLKAIGAWTSVGPEVFADAMDELSATEAGAAAGASLARFL